MGLTNSFSSYSNKIKYVNDGTIYDNFYIDPSSSSLFQDQMQQWNQLTTEQRNKCTSKITFPNITISLSSDATNKIDYTVKQFLSTGTTKQYINTKTGSLKASIGRTDSTNLVFDSYQLILNSSYRLMGFEISAYAPKNTGIITARYLTININSAIVELNTYTDVYYFDNDGSSLDDYQKFVTVNSRNDTLTNSRYSIGKVSFRAGSFENNSMTENEHSYNLKILVDQKDKYFLGWATNANSLEPVYWKTNQYDSGLTFAAYNPTTTDEGIPVSDVLKIKDTIQVYLFYACWAPKYYINFINTLNYDKTNVEKDYYESIALTEQSHIWNAFTLQSNGFYKATLKNLTGSPWCRTVFYFDITALSHVKITYQYKNMSFNNSIACGLSEIQKSSAPTPEWINCSQIYVSGGWNIYDHAENYLISSAIDSYKQRTRNLIDYSDTTSCLYVTPGRYYFVAQLQGMDIDQLTNTQKEAIFFEFKIETRNANSEPQYDPTMQVSIPVPQEGSAFFNSSTYSKMLLTTSKYQHEGWKNNLELADPLNPGSTIKGPSAIYVSNDNNYYSTSDTVKGTIEIQKPVTLQSYTTTSWYSNSAPIIDNTNHTWKNSNQGIVSSYCGSTISFYVPGACVVRARGTCSSEASCDKIIFSKLNETLAHNNNSDTTYQATISGLNQTINVPYTITNAGTYSFDVKYRKDGSVDSGSDTAEFTISIDSGYTYTDYQFNSDMYLYSIEQQKYTPRFYDYPHTNSAGLENIHKTSTSQVSVGSDIYMDNTTTGSPIERTGFAFKGWTILNNTTNTTYNEDRDSSSYYYEPNNSYSLTLAMINNGTIDEDNNYFYLNFYPVWNPKLNITYYDTLHNLNNSNVALVEKGYDYTLSNNHYGASINNFITSNSINEKGYNFIGWVLQNKDEQNQNLILYGPLMNDEYLYYQDTSVTSSNFNSKKSSLYIENNHTYSSALNLTFNASTKYYKRIEIFTNGSQIEQLQTDLSLYAVWRRKYKTRYYNNYPNGSILSSTQENLIYNDLDIKTPASNLPTKNGYVFKGWTIYTDDNHLDYSTYYNPSSTNGFYESNSYIGPIDDIILNQATTTRNNDASGTGYFYIDFYPVWNPCYTLTFISSYPNIVGGNKIKTTANVAERGEDFIVTSAYFPSNITNDGYELQGWTERLPDDSNVVGKSAAIKNTWYEQVTFTAGNETVEFEEKKFLLYVKSGSVYNKIIKNTNPSTLSYSSGTTYYMKYTDLESTGDTIEGDKIYKDLTYYAIWKKKYQIIFKNANNENISTQFKFENDDVTEVGNSSLPKTNIVAPTVTYSDPTSSGSGNYGFIYNTESQEYISQNKNQNNSYALGRFSFTVTNKCSLIITARNNSQILYDYGIFSNLNQSLSASSSADSSSTIVKMKGYNTANTYKIYYNIPAAGTYYFEAKYIKNSSTHTNDDELRFNISFVNLNKDFQGWTRSISNNIYESRNTSNFFEIGNIPSVKDEQVNNNISGGAFQIIYYPVWSSKYSIFLINPDLNQGVGCLNEISYNSAKSITNNDFANNISTYTANGYTYEGWSSSIKIGPSVSQGASDYDLTDAIENIVSDITLYLILKHKYRIQFYNYNKTSIFSTIENEPLNEEIYLSNEPTQTGYEFIGWALSNIKINYYYTLTETEKESIYLKDAPLKKIANTDASRNNSSGYFIINYYSVWDKKYNISLKDNLHNLNQVNTYKISYNNDADFTLLTKPTSIVDNGYELLGWRNSIIPTIIYTKVSDESTTNYGFEQIDSKNHIWKSSANTAKNSYSLGRFSFTVTKACTIIITAQNNSNAGYHYGIFSNLNTELTNSYTADTINVKATGKNTRNEYIVTYDIPSSGTYSFDVKYIHDNRTQNYCDNLIFNIAFDIPPDNYIGPNVELLENDYNSNQSTIINITSDITLYAIYKKKYRVLFLNDSEEILQTLNTNSNTSEPFYNTNSNIDIPNITPIKTNYVFKGWTTSSNSEARNYLTKTNDNFYDETFEIKDSDSLPIIRTNYTDYFDIKFYPVWNQIFTITFKDTISTANKSHTIEAGEDFNFTDYTMINLNEETNAYIRLGWTLRDYTQESEKATICGPSAYKDNTNDFNNDDDKIPASLIIKNLILYAIQKKKYTLRFYNSNNSVLDTDENYYLGDSIEIFPEADKLNNVFKGWTLDSSATAYDPTNDSIIYNSSEGLPDIEDTQATSLTNGYFYINYYPVFNPLYNISYYDIDEYSGNWIELITIEEIEAGTTHSISNNSYENKLKYKPVGWNTTQSFPISTTPTYNLSGNTITVNANINFYLACQKRYGLKIEDENLDNYNNYAITIDHGSAIYESDEDIYYYDYGQNLKIILTPKNKECFISKKYNNEDSDLLIYGPSHRTLSLELSLNASTYDTSKNNYNILSYSLGKGIKFTPIIQLNNQYHTEEYYNTNFYINGIALKDYNKNFVTYENYIQKTIPSEKDYYYLGDTIICTFEHRLLTAPAVQYYIEQISFQENNTWFEEEDPVNKNRNAISNGFTNNYATYTYTHTVTLNDIKEDGKSIKIIPYYVPYNNIIHIGGNSHINLSVPPESDFYTFRMWTGAPTNHYSEGYFYIFNNQSRDYYITITPKNISGFIPTSFTYKDPSMNVNETISIYNFLNQEIPGSNWKNFYYNNKYTLNTIGIKLTPEDTSTYHEGLYELRMTGSAGYLQKVDIISKPISKLEITKAAETILEKTEENHLTFYINSSLLGENNTSYLVQDQKDSGLSFKEFKLDTADTYNVITKSDIIDNNISLPSGWTRTESKDHTDIITYVNNDLSTRNGYIDYVTITFDESLPLFYVDQKALQLYWENTKAEGLYWENIRLL